MPFLVQPKKSRLMLKSLLCYGSTKREPIDWDIYHICVSILKFLPNWIIHQVPKFKHFVVLVVTIFIIPKSICELCNELGRHTKKFCNEHWTWNMNCNWKLGIEEVYLKFIGLLVKTFNLNKTTLHLDLFTFSSSKEWDWKTIKFFMKMLRYGNL